MTQALSAAANSDPLVQVGVESLTTILGVRSVRADAGIVEVADLTELRRRNGVRREFGLVPAEGDIVDVAIAVIIESVALLGHRLELLHAGVPRPIDTALFRD